MAIPHPYGRLQFGADLDLHFRTLIGTGCNPERRGGRGDRHRGPVDEEGRRRHRGHRQARRRLRHRAARRPRHDHAGIEGGARVRPVGEREAARDLRALRAVGLDQVRRVRHDVGLRRQPHGRQRLRQALRPGLHAGVRRDLGDHRRRGAAAVALPHAGGLEALHVHVRPLPGHDQPPQDVRPLRLAADQGQHRRRPHDDRGEGARQHPEDRQALRDRRRDRQGRGPDRPRPVVHGQLVGRGRDGHAVRGVRLSSCTSSRRGRAT